MLSFSAMAISFLTLIIFIYQTNLISKQNFLPISPYLSFSKSDSPVNNSFSLKLENFGIVPAIIEGVSVKFKGETYDLADYEYELLRLLKEKAPKIDSIKVMSYSTLDKGCKCCHIRYSK